MLLILILVTAVFSIISGITVLILGHWHDLGLKFAGITLSMLASLSFLGFSLIDPGVLHCAVDKDFYIGLSCSVIARNLSVIFFNIAIGRDAIALKGRDRRFTTHEAALAWPLTRQRRS